MRSWTPLENPTLRLTKSRCVAPEGLVSLLLKLTIGVIVRVARTDLGQLSGLQVMGHCSRSLGQIVSQTMWNQEL